MAHYMVETVLCDLCGENTTEVFTTWTIKSPEYQEQTLDLCPECNPSIIEWWEMGTPVGRTRRRRSTTPATCPKKGCGFVAKNANGLRVHTRRIHEKNANKEA